MIKKPNPVTAALLSFAKFVGYSIALALLAGLPEKIVADWRAWAALGGLAGLKAALTYITVTCKTEI